MADDSITRRIKMNELRMLQAVARHGSMSSAAGDLNISQSAVSKALRELEHKLRVRLLDRSPQGVEPTIYGHALLARGLAIFDELQQGLKDIEFIADPCTGDVRIGVSSPMVGFLFVVIEALSRKFPRLVFNVVEADTNALQNGSLRERRIDLMLGRIATPFEDTRFEGEPLFDDQLSVIAGQTNPWARRRKIKLADLVNESWVLPAPSDLAGLRAVEMFHAQGLPSPRATVIANSTRLRDRLLATGRYLAVAPAVELRFSDNATQLKVLPIDIRLKPRPMGIVMLKNRTLSGAAVAFIEIARKLAA